MKKELTYNEAFTKLEKLVGDLEEGDIPLDKLSEKVRQANELIAICDGKLRGIDKEVKEALKSTTTGKKAKKG
jgi:exodeoxyribonuclease VII small subunit